MTDSAYPKRCICGWKRPLIAVTMGDGSLPPAGLVPVYACPECGLFYAAGELSEDILRRVSANLQIDLLRALRPKD